MTLGNDNGTDGQTDGQTDRRTDRVRRNMRPLPREEGRIKKPVVNQIHSPDGHDQHEHDDGDLHHPVATDAGAVVKAGVIARARRAAAAAMASVTVMVMMAVMLVLITAADTS